jgi:glycosyltransferase involved in cell wall biosynthesis
MSQEVKTLLVLTPAFPKNESETSWVPSQQLLVKNLKSQFPHLNILVYSFLYPYEQCEYDWHQVKIFAFGGMQRKKLKRLLLWRNIWQRLKKAKKQNNVIGILSFWCSECALLGSWFARSYGIKHLCWICGQDARRLNKYVKWIRPNAAELMAISDFVNHEFTRNHKVKPGFTIPNGVDTNLFSEELPAQRDIDILGAGSLIPLKQYDVFTEIVATLQQSFQNIKAIHCGDGREKKNIDVLISKYEIGNNFHLLGSKKHQELLHLMQRAKLFLHTSEYEGFSTVCLEALYAGCQVISFTKPMNHDIQNWHIVNSKEEMVMKASQLLSDNRLSHERVLVYSLKDIACQTMQLFV